MGRRRSLNNQHGLGLALLWSDFPHHEGYLSGSKYCRSTITAQGNISVLMDAFAWINVTLIAIRSFYLVTHMYWTL
jgi:hypothetical protein